MAAPSPVVVMGDRGTEGHGVSGRPTFQTGVPILGRTFAVLVLPSKSYCRPARDLGRGFKSHLSPSAPLFIRPFPLLPGPPAGPGAADLSPDPRPAIQARAPLPHPVRAAWRAAVDPSVVEATGVAVCGGHFAEEPGAGGMQMRQTQGGERRSPEETGGRALGRGDGCLPRGREEGAARSGRRWVRAAGPGRRGACAGLRGAAARSVAHPPPPPPPSYLGSRTPSRRWVCAPRCKQNS